MMKYKISAQYLQIYVCYAKNTSETWGVNTTIALCCRKP